MSVKQEHQALIYVMVLMSAADNDMTDKELFTIGEIVKTFRSLAAWISRSYPTRRKPAPTFSPRITASNPC